MSDYYISRYTEGRLAELREEAARQRLARSVRVRQGRRRRLAERRGLTVPTVASPCCA